MGQALVVTAPHQLAYETFDDVALKPDEVRIQTLFSGISAGTEMTQYRGTNPFMHKRWDEAHRLFVPGEKISWDYPVRNLGYEEVGEIVELGSAVHDIALGTHVFGTWGHRTHHVANLDYVRPRLMPRDADPIFGIFSHIGAVALNGTHDAHIRIGDTVAVFGLGTLGQIVAQAAQQSGARSIVSNNSAVRSNGARCVMSGRKFKIPSFCKRIAVCHRRILSQRYFASGSTPEICEPTMLTRL